MRGKRAKAIRRLVDSVVLNDEHLDGVEETPETERAFKKCYARLLRKWWSRNIDRKIIKLLTEDS